MFEGLETCINGWGDSCGFVGDEASRYFWNFNDGGYFVTVEVYDTRSDVWSVVTF